MLAWKETSKLHTALLGSNNQILIWYDTQTGGGGGERMKINGTKLMDYSHQKL